MPMDLEMSGPRKIEELFDLRLSDFERIRTIAARISRDERTKPKANSRYADRIKEALNETALGDAMEKCNPALACGSVFCDYCRERKQDRLYYAFRKHCNDRFEMDEIKASKNLRFISVLHEPVMIDENHMDIEIFERLQDSVDQMKLQLTTLHRKLKKDGHKIWMRGAIHLEMLDYNMFYFAGQLGSQSTKVKTIRQFFDNKQANLNRGFLVHFHALIDGYGIDDMKLRRYFTDYWNQVTKQVHMQKTWTKVAWRDKNGIKGEKIQSLDDNLKGIARYCHNGSNPDLRYASNWGTGKIVQQPDITEAKSKDQITNEIRGNIVDFAVQVMDYRLDELLNYHDIYTLVLAHKWIAGDSNRGMTIAIY
jgi:hypothetical protein